MLFTHSLYSGGPKDVIAECEWLENVPVNEQGEDAFLPRVRFAPDSNFNLRSRFVFLRQCAGYNIMLAPHDPWDNSNGVYDVIDRWRTHADHSI